MGIKFIEQIKGDYFYQKGEYFILEPNKEQDVEIKELIKSESGKMIQGEEIPSSVNRWILENLSNFAEEVKSLTDEQIDEVLEKATIDMKNFAREMVRFIEDKISDIIFENEQLYKEASNTIDGFLKTIESNVKQNETIKNIVKLARKSGIKITNKEVENKTLEEVVEIINNKGKR